MKFQFNNDVQSHYVYLETVDSDKIRLFVIERKDKQAIIRNVTQTSRNELAETLNYECKTYEINPLTGIQVLEPIKVDLGRTRSVKGYCRCIAEAYNSM